MSYDLSQFKVVLSDKDSIPQSPFLKLIAGDASDRKFYRLCNHPQGSAICMQFPKWEGGYGGDPLSWINMHESLDKMGLPVPRVYQIDEKNCCIWTEDLGDQFLSSALKKNTLTCGETESIEYYKRALSLLVKAQYPLEFVDHIAKQRHFDFEKLYFEMNFFIIHFLNGFLDLNVASGNQKWMPLFDEMGILCKKLDASPRVLCHRDYHVRNIMLKDKRLFWIDFQDARMGPCSYDVVSLVRDSYVQMDWALRFELLDHYLSEMNRARQTLTLAPVSEEAFYEEVLLMGLQRNIKAMGSFAYLAVQKSKPSYLNHVFHTLSILASPQAQKYKGVNIRSLLPNIFELIDSLYNGELSDKLRNKIKEYT